MPAPYSEDLRVRIEPEKRGKAQQLPWQSADLHLRQEEFAMRYFSDGRIELDTGRVERQIREPVMVAKITFFAVRPAPLVASPAFMRWSAAAKISASTPERILPTSSHGCRPPIRCGKSTH